jgi:hypothetical protein
MLPMRRATGLFIVPLIVATAVGCKNQSTPLTNPFLTPDRVPPPSTRVLTPGTAQPYYPGDPVPGAAPISAYPAGALPPAGVYPPATVPPANAYPAGPAYPVGNPVTPTAPVTPPGGWGTYPSQAKASGDAVTVPNDGQQLRFAAATPNIPAIAPTTPRLPAVDRAFTPNAGAQSGVQQAAYDEAPAAGQPGPQRLQMREVAPSEYMSPRSTVSSTATTATPSRDGFRPQGSEPRSQSIDSPTGSAMSKGFRPPSLAGGTVAAADSNERFGVGPSQEWLRGQLEYWPEAGEWSIRYMGDGPVDQIGGRILIDNPQVLGNLPPGEFVMVQGQVFGRQIDEASYRPAYRVAVVQRQR